MRACSSPPPLRSALLVLALLVGSACGHKSGRFVWVDQLPDTPAAPADGYIIHTGDLLSVRVWNQDAMSARARVRQDGRISLPFLNDVEAAGFAPAVLAQQLQTRLKDFIVNPVVTISLEELRPFSVSVLGEVARQGVFQLEPGAGLLHALASAGGLTDYAHVDRIYVVRPGTEPQRIRFTYDMLTRAESRAATFRLQTGDVVMVE